MRVAGAVLCGGASRRMGTDKALVEVQGRPMVMRVAAALEAAGCDPVLTVGGDSVALTTLGLRHVEDEHPGLGPLGGLLTALAHAHDAGALFVAACDLAWLDGETVGSVIAGLGDHDVALARTARVEPLCAVWRTTVRSMLEQRFAAGERSVHGVLELVDHVLVDVPDLPLRNVNAPGDLDPLR
jgi:molybdopterin-guanine dinucleotide biosynthesis protein A